jgi:hypothetical protein
MRRLADYYLNRATSWEEIRFRGWCFYAEAGLAKQDVQVSIYTNTLKVGYEETELAFYTVSGMRTIRISRKSAILA